MSETNSSITLLDRKTTACLAANAFRQIADGEDDDAGPPFTPEQILVVHLDEDATPEMGFCSGPKAEPVPVGKWVAWFEVDGFDEPMFTAYGDTEADAVDALTRLFRTGIADQLPEGPASVPPTDPAPTPEELDALEAELHAREDQLLTALVAGQRPVTLPEASAPITLTLSHEKWCLILVGLEHVAYELSGETPILKRDPLFSSPEEKARAERLVTELFEELSPALDF